MGMVTAPLSKNAQNAAQKADIKSTASQLSASFFEASVVARSPIKTAPAEGEPAKTEPSGSALLDSFAATGVVEMDFAAALNLNAHLQSNTLIAETIARRAQLKALQSEKQNPERRQVERFNPPSQPPSQPKATESQETQVATSSSDQAVIKTFDKTTLQTLEKALGKAIDQAATIKAAAKVDTTALRQDSRDQPVTVYGGPQYKAMNAKAAAGGLVDLEDRLLFGGADSQFRPQISARQDSAHDDATVLEYLAQQATAFSFTHITTSVQSLKSLISADFAKFITQVSQAVPASQVVLNASRFEVSEPTHRLQMAHPAEPAAQATENGPAQTEAENLSSLSDQLNALNQKIAFLSQKIAALQAAQAAGHPALGSAAAGVWLSGEQRDELDNEPSGEGGTASNYSTNQAILDVAIFKLDEPMPDAESPSAKLV